MKKFLALVLALVMTMSLVTIAGAEDFTDAADVNYTEAVEVMTAVGVVGGYADGSFNPQAGLTRGAAAKIICNMILGPTTAGALAADSAPYSDVAVDNVFAGYIAYCAKEGIISGYADGTFRPAAPLTGYAFMKMLLGALGYDADIEGYTGANWSINVAKRALNIGLDAGLEGDFVGTKALTREEAALYAFNTMKATMVNYGTRTNISVGDINISTQADATSNGADGVDYTTNTNTGNTTEEFCEKFFSNLKVTVVDDAYGRPANQWKIKNEKVGTYAETPVLTYNAEVKGTVLADDLDDAGVAAYDSTAADSAAIDFDIFINGEDCTAWGTYFTTALADVGDVKAVLDQKTNLTFTGKGFNMEIFANDDGELTRIVVLTPYLAKVTAIEKDSETTRSVDERALTVQFTNYANSTVTLTLDADVTGFDAVYGTVAKNDYVIITPNAGDVTAIDAAVDVTLPEVVKGAISFVKANSELKMDGVTYKSTAIYDQVGANFALTTKEATLYLDANGYVLGYAGPSTTADKGVIVVKQFKTLDDEGALVDKIKGITSDGAEVEWKIPVGASYTVGDIYTYTKNEDTNVYTLAQSFDAAYAEGAEVVLNVSTAIATTDKSLKLDGTNKAYYADDVKFIFVDNEGKSVVKEGVQKVPAGKWVLGIIDMDDTTAYIKTVFVANASAAASSTTSDDVVFVSSADSGDISVIVDGKEKTFDVYTAYVNGVKVENFYAASASQYAFYSIEVDDETGAYVTAGNTYTASTGDYAVKSSLTVSAIAGNVASMSDSADYSLAGAVIVDTTINGNAIDTVAKLQTAISKGTVTVSMMYDADNNNVAYVYVTGYTAW